MAKGAFPHYRRCIAQPQPSRSGHWIEEVPQLVKQNESTPAGVTWTCRLADGSLATATRLESALPGWEARAQRLATLQDPRLVELLGGAERDGQFWLISAFDAGVSLSRLASAGPLSPAASVQIAADILGGLAVLHQAGLAHGQLGGGTVRTLPDGQVWLTAYGLAMVTTGRRSAEADQAQDLAIAGRLVCALLGIPSGMAPGSPLTPLETSRPALAAAARRIAAPGSGQAALTARAALALLLEAAGTLAEEEAGRAGRAEIAERVVAAGGSPTVFSRPTRPPSPSASPVPPTPSPASLLADAPAVAAAGAAGLRDLAVAAASTAAAAVPRLKEQLETLRGPGPTPPAGPPPERRPPQPRPPQRSLTSGGLGRWWLPGALAALALIPIVVIAANLANGHNPAPATTALGHHHSSPPTARRQPAPTPTAPPTQATTPPSPTAAAAANVKSVAISPQGACSPGSSCPLEVTVTFPQLSNPVPVSWSFTLTPCGGAPSTVKGSTINAQSGWTHVIGDTTVAMPSASGVQVVAVTSSPGQASSPPLSVGSACS